MKNQSRSTDNEELGFFYDNIHGRISLDELPREFHPTLKAVLSSRALNRLKRISQLGHTSLSYFSATHTRFSHALGSMLVMNKLFLHIRKQENGLPHTLFKEVERTYVADVKNFHNTETFIRCHLLLAALYQDVGELPFQKVTSLYFRPADNEVARLANKLSSSAKPKSWKGKDVFSMLALLSDKAERNPLGSVLASYNVDFLAFLITGFGQPATAPNLVALRQMVDGAVDADRLDYVYRDAAVTIGSLSRPTTVLESITSYGIDHVVVSDPRPVVDFLSTRMRLWTFVYSAPDVRFRQTLLKTFLQGRLDSPETPVQFRDSGLEPELRYDEFVDLDDHSLVSRIRDCNGRAAKTLRSFRLEAAKLLLGNTLDYECRMLRQPDEKVADLSKAQLATTLPDELFFDLFRDHDRLQLYRPNSVRVQQSLTEEIDRSTSTSAASPLGIEYSSGAMSPMFSQSDCVVLVPKSYYVFRPRKRTGERWSVADKAIRDGTLFWRLAWTDAERALACKCDTREEPGFTGKTISVSYCSDDLPTVIRIVQELNKAKRRYWLFLRPFDGVGSTAEENSKQLINEAKAVLAVVSKAYLTRAQGKGYINLEVSAMHDQGDRIPTAVLGADERDALNNDATWAWGKMKERWRKQSQVICYEHKLADENDAVIGEAVKAALKAIDTWKRR